MSIASKWYFSSGFLRKALYMSLLSFMCDTKHFPFVVFDLITLMKYD
jgi:hypothetical protein